MLDYILLYTDQASAKADLAPWLVAGNWPPDHSIAGLPIWRQSQDTKDAQGNVVHTPLTGFAVQISLPALDTTLRDKAAILAVIDRDLAAQRRSGLIVKSNVTNAVLQDLMFAEFSGACVPFGSVLLDPPPLQAAAVGYMANTFNSSMNLQEVDANNTRLSRFKWFPWSFFGNTVPASSQFVSNADGSLTVTGGAGTQNGQLSTAVNVGAGKWSGVAFGGGAYVEAIVKFDPTFVNTAHGWPSFWSMAVEHLMNLTALTQWPGQPAGYERFIEADFFEYDTAQSGANTFGNATHDWYGPASGYSRVTPSFSDLLRTVPPGTDWNTFNKIGWLWVPATDSGRGYSASYFNDVQIGSVQSWNKFTGTESPPPVVGSTAFNVLDRQHVALILGTGTDSPMTIKSVRAWQTDGTMNLRY